MTRRPHIAIRNIGVQRACWRFRCAESRDGHNHRCKCVCVCGFTLREHTSREARRREVRA